MSLATSVFDHSLDYVGNPLVLTDCFLSQALSYS